MQQITKTRKRTATVLLIMFGMTLFLAPVIAEEKLSGYEIAEKAKYANDPKSSKTTATLKLFSSVDATSPTETRQVVMKSKKQGKGNNKTVFRFMNSKYRGTTFLSIEKPGQNTKYYLYLNSVGRARQLSSSEKQNNFIDTDFTNEDLGGVKLNEYKYKRIADMERDGQKYYRIWAYKKDEDARFPKYLALINAETFVIAEMRVFNKSGKLAKIGKFTKVRKVGGKFHMPFHLEVQDVIKDHKTVIEVSSIKVDIPIRNSIFKSWNMNKAW